MTIERTETNVLKATKRGAVQVFGWIDPQGTVHHAIDKAVCDFESLYIPVTDADKKMMQKAVKSLYTA